MATLQVTNLQNTAATVTNVSLLADGSTTIVLDSTGTARTGGIRYNTGVLEVYDGAAWVAAGGGSGTVTGVTASLPLVSSGGATPNLTINAATAGALGAVQVGTNLQVTGGGTISIFDASDTQKGVVEMATAAEAATGTSTILAAPVAFSVPKDAANMTGAAILPSGTDAQRTAIASPVVGMTRFNTDYAPDSLEVYDGTNWKQVAYVPPIATPPDLTISANGPLPSSGVYNNITINAGVTATLSGLSYLKATGTVTINGAIQGVGTGVPGPTSFLSNGSASGTGAGGQVGQGGGGGGFPASGGGAGGAAYGFFPYLSSSGSIGFSVTTSGGISGARAGAAGGSLVIVAKGAINVGAAAVISVDGGRWI